MFTSSSPCGIGIGVEENGIIVVWVTPKLLAKSSQLALDGLP